MDTLKYILIVSLGTLSLGQCAWGSDTPDDQARERRHGFHRGGRSFWRGIRKYREPNETQSEPSDKREHGSRQMGRAGGVPRPGGRFLLRPDFGHHPGRRHSVGDLVPGDASKPHPRDGFTLKPDFGHHPGRRHSFAGFPPGHPGGDHVPGDTHRPHFGGRFPLKRGFGFPPGGPHFPGGPGFGPFEEPSNEKKQQLIDAYKKCNGDFKEMVLEPPYKERFEKFTENAKERFAKMLEFQYNRAIKGQKRADSEPATSKDAHRKPVTEQKKND